MSDPDHVVSSLAAAATVQLLPVGGESKDFWGSGFFVAPGWVVTCAHVVRSHLPAGPGGQLDVRGDGFNDGISVHAELADWRLMEREGRVIPVERDLALVRLLDPDIEHECVWFTDRATRVMRTVLVHGYRPGDPDGTGTRAVSFQAKGEINVHDGGYGLVIAPGAEYPKGVSGGPLVDPLTNEVVGVIKSRRKDREGGLAIAAAALRGFGGLYQQVMAGHDSWHAARKGHQTWISRQWSSGESTGRRDTGTGFGPGSWTPRDRRKALGLLAELPAPATGAPIAAVAHKAARNELAPAKNALLSWRDGYGLLYDGDEPLGALVFLRYLQLVARYVHAYGGKSGQLSEWITDRLEEVAHPFQHELVTEVRLPEQLWPDAGQPGRTVLPYPGPGEGPVITVVMDPLHDDASLVDWTIHLFTGDGGSEQIGAYEEAAPGVDAAWHNHQSLRRTLHEVLHAHDPDPDHPLPVEIALPLGGFDTPVHRWQLEDAARLNKLAHLGAQRRLVLRDLGRRGRWSEEAERDIRWQAVAGAERLTVARIPEPGTTQRAAYYEGLTPGAVPVLCRPASRGVGATAMELTLRAGHGIALWDIDGHTGRGCEERCTELRGRVQGLLDRTDRACELPDRIRHLREDIDPRRPETHWPESLVLLYDDPGRSLPADDEETLDSP
ncbi:MULTISPECIES: trypsin-like peptidase domain-containing protein [unclassified Streptomyces]|uniref:VMAP-C domain-containing protein n=1 Tax=unclassified Streptomyces TaxID=2593676 RepID=UPI00202403E8|nr:MULTISPECIES: trypsin-like peptidase domain-containing protein [unclassified Streptomyces]WSC19903.1 serine protease [Streptomyces sp. NBC_01766]